MLHYKPFIIEFAGLPGAGKTTTSNALIELLKERGLKAGCYREMQETALSSKKELFSAIGTKSFKVLIAIIWLTINTRPFRKDRLKCSKTLYILYLKFLHIYKSNSKYDIWIMEQGILQGILSLLHEDRLNNEKLLRKLVSAAFENINLINIICDVDPEMAFKRIKSRRLNQGRLDRITNDEILRRILNVQNENLSKICAVLESMHIKNVHVDTNKDIDNNELLLNEIRKLIVKEGLNNV